MKIFLKKSVSWKKSASENRILTADEHKTNAHKLFPNAYYVFFYSPQKTQKQ